MKYAKFITRFSSYFQRVMKTKIGGSDELNFDRIFIMVENPHTPFGPPDTDHYIILSTPAQKTLY